MQDNHTHYAADIGRSHGTAAARQAFDGNTDDETYRRVLAGIEDGDPEILDAYRVPDLSGGCTRNGKWQRAASTSPMTITWRGNSGVAKNSRMARR